MRRLWLFVLILSLGVVVPSSTAQAALCVGTGDGQDDFEICV